MLLPLFFAPGVGTSSVMPYAPWGLQVLAYTLDFYIASFDFSAPFPLQKTARGAAKIFMGPPGNWTLVDFPLCDFGFCESRRGRNGGIKSAGLHFSCKALSIEICINGGTLLASFKNENSDKALHEE